MPSPSRTMRVALVTTVALVALVAPPGGEVQGLEPSMLVGHWACDGRLLSVELRKKYGALPVDLLKTNFTFDLTMRQGVCELKRVK